MKARIKENGVFDVLSMSLFTMTELPDWYFVSLINAEFISLYVDNFINNTSHFQINDARQLPIIIPNEDVLQKIKSIAFESITIKQQLFLAKIDEDCANKELLKLQNKLDVLVLSLYAI